MSAPQPPASPYGPPPVVPHTAATQTADHPGTRDSPRRAGIALVAFWAGVATVLAGTAYTLLLPVLLRSASYASVPFAALGAVHGVVSVVLALVATGTGLVALARRVPGTGFAAAGTALGAAALLSVVVGLLQGALLRVL